MRVGFVTGSVSRSAAGPFESLRGLSAAMHHPPELEVRVLGLADANTETDLTAWGQVPVSASAVRGPQSFGYSPYLAGAIRDATVDLLHVHGLWMFSSIAAMRWSRRAGLPGPASPRCSADRTPPSGRRPYLVSPHGMLDRWALRHRSWKKRLASALYETRHLRGAACLHALNEAELATIRAFGLCNPVCVIPNGVELSNRHTSSPALWRASIPRHGRVLLYFGRLHPKKGLFNLLRAWTELWRTHPATIGDWHLVIAGWDQKGYRAQLENTFWRGTGDRVRFIGPQFAADKKSTLDASDAFILPSVSEGLPMAVLEAWAHALPVLMTPECNLPEGFAAGAALPIQPTPEGIARQLCKLFAMSDEQRHAIGCRGRELVATSFGWSGAAAQLTAVYQWLLGIGPCPKCVRLA